MYVDDTRESALPQTLAATAICGGTGMTGTTTQQNEFIESLGGEIPTGAQGAQLLALALQGETGASAPEPVAQPGAASATATTAGDAGETGTNTTTAAAAGQPELTADNAVILAKDGKHTISFDKLVEARQQGQHWKALAEQTQAQLATLQQDAQARATAGAAPTQVDNQVATAQAAIDKGVDPSIFGDFSEEALAKGIEQLVSQQVAARVESIVNQRLAPIQQQQATTANQAHYGAIYEKHPDADSLVESAELANWIKAQPSFAQDGYRAVLDKGNTQQVIELFDRFKQATGVAQPVSAEGAAAAVADPKAAAQAAVDAAKTPIPNSLTDFPGGRPTGLTREDQMAGMESRELLASMSTMTPKQIDQFLNRRM